MLNTCMRDIIVYTWRQTEYAYKVPELLRTLVGKNITPEIESKLTEMETYVDFINKRSEKVTEYDIAKNTIKVLSIGAKLTKREYQNHVVILLRAAADWESAADTEKCAAYMLQVLNDFCAELPSSGENCYIYRNILEEAREGLPYRYIGLRA